MFELLLRLEADSCELMGCPKQRSWHIITPFSPPDRKLVIMESFSDVVNLDRIAAFLAIHSLSQVPLSKPLELFLFSGSH